MFEFYTLHSRFRHAMLEICKQGQIIEAPECHTVWSQLWKKRSQNPCDEFAGLAWYHDYQINREQSHFLWTFLASQARSEGRMKDYANLIGWWNPIGLESDRLLDHREALALVSLALEIESGYFLPLHRLSRSINCLRRASGSLRKDTDPQTWAMAQFNMGGVLHDLGCRMGGVEGGKLFGRAVMAYQAALEVWNEADYPNENRMVISGLGNIQSSQNWRKLTDSPGIEIINKFY